MSANYTLYTLPLGSLKSCGFLRSQSGRVVMLWNVVVRFEPGGLTVS